MSTPALGAVAAANVMAASRTGLVSVTRRYGFAAAGPLCISAAHFIAAILLLRAFDRAGFGLFAFVLVIVPFCLSLSGALIGAPVAIAARRSAICPRELSTYLQANLTFGSIAAASVCLLLVASRADVKLALVFGAYGGAMTLRWFARTLCYATGSPLRVAISDLFYSLILLTGLLLLLVLHELTALTAAETFLGAAIAGLLGFGRSYLRQQFLAHHAGSLVAYRQIWMDLARWSALGVLFTEFTVNAHAYLVTFIAGPAAFAPLAAGALFMRPVQLVLTAVPDLERPIMARLLERGDHAGARKSVNQFRMAAGAVWLVTVTLSAALLMWYPQLILKKAYDPSQAAIVLAFFAAITLARTLRTPESVLLQAAGQFRALAGASLVACVVSLAATLALLVLVGPIFSLAGIFAGELVMMGRVLTLSRNWMRERA